MGICSDQEIMQLIGTDDTSMKKMAPCIMECHNLKIFTPNQALSYIGSKLKVKRYTIFKKNLLLFIYFFKFNGVNFLI